MMNVGQHLHFHVLNSEILIEMLLPMTVIDVSRVMVALLPGHAGMESGKERIGAWVMYKV